MNNVEEIISTKIKNGWRAIIYDAPWATFKPDQDGVIITSDGRACETTDDNKDSIIIVADSNVLPVKRENGHVLFRQKGSDLFDIVCLYQSEGKEISLKIEDINGNETVTIDGCNGTYTDFKNKLKVYETIDGVKGRELKKDEYEIKAPLPQYFSDNVPNDGDEPKKTDITISYIKYSKVIQPITFNESLVITTMEGEQDNIDKNASAIDLSNIYAERISDATYLYEIKRKPNNDTECKGGTVTFSLEKTLTEDPQYLIHIHGIEVQYVIVTTQCGEEIRRRTEPGDNNGIVYTVEGNVSNVTTTEDGDISLSISDSVNYFTLIAENSIGVKSKVILYRDSTDGSFKSQINN